MSKFNLLDEPWISVVTDYKGKTELVSLREFFQNAHNYIDLAGDMPTQDFAVLRFLLAILHTVFSRYDANGDVYEWIDVNDRMQQVENVDEEDEEEYEDALMDTWKNLWEAGKFPDIIVKYLEAWHDRFYLFDDDYPFYQVNEKDIEPSKLNKGSPTSIFGKNINRTISESSNKISIFSPKFGENDNKEKLNYAQATRWILMYQSYTGLSDKVIFGKEKYKASKGWLFDLGGIYTSYNNLFKTLLLNLRLINNTDSHYNYSIQKPCWELTPNEVLENRFYSGQIDNIAELYTVWSRALYISDFNEGDVFKMDIVKLPDISHEDQFLEPMTIWRYNDSGEYKNHFTPRKHQFNKSMWRSFGLITLNEASFDGNKNNPKRKPGIIEWLNFIDSNIKDKNIVINAISMEDDGNATSWVPTNEIADKMLIEAAILNDLNDKGWVYVINDVVEETKETVDEIFRSFLNKIRDIRNLEATDFTTNHIEKLYFKIDKPFRDWLSGIDYHDSKNDKINTWKEELKTIVIGEANQIIKNSSQRDFTGRVVNDSMMNIATAFNSFMSRINKKL